MKWIPGHLSAYLSSLMVLSSKAQLLCSTDASVSPASCSVRSTSQLHNNCVSPHRSARFNGGDLDHLQWDKERGGVRTSGGSALWDERPRWRCSVCGLWRGRAKDVHPQGHSHRPQACRYLRWVPLKYDSLPLTAPRHHVGKASFFSHSRVISVYHCGSDDGWSDVFSFAALNDSASFSPRFALYGDLGNENPQSLARLQKETQLGMYDAILHIGELSADKEDCQRSKQSGRRRFNSCFLRRLWSTDTWHNTSMNPKCVIIIYWWLRASHLLPPLLVGTWNLKR